MGCAIQKKDLNSGNNFAKNAKNCMDYNTQELNSINKKYYSFPEQSRFINNNSTHVLSLIQRMTQKTIFQYNEDKLAYNMYLGLAITIKSKR